MEKQVNRIGGLYDTENQKHQAGSIYDRNGSEPNLKQQMCDQLLAEGKVKEFDVIRHSYSNARMQDGRTQNKDTNLSPTLDTRCDCLGVCVKDTSYVGQSGMVQPVIYDDYNQRIKADQTCINTLTTNCGNDAERNGVKIIEYVPLDEQNGVHPFELSEAMKKYIVSYDSKYKVGDGNLKLNRDIACSKTTREGNTRADASDFISPDFGTNENVAGKDLSSYRIRKLTPKECGRLMGVKDEDIDKMSVNQSNSRLYHLYGDSIVVDVLMEIFREVV